MSMTLRIFVSSPSDVRAERLRAQLIIQKLARDYAGRVQLVPYFWETEPLRATGHFQDDIEPPSTHDIVVLILWSRLGTLLPAQTELREYKGIDGRAPVTGTEWEFEDALASFRIRHAPDLLAYRRTGDPGLSLTNEVLRAEQEQQWQGLQAFWARHFENKGEFLAASGRYGSLDEFDAKLEADLSALVERRLRAQSGETSNGGRLYLKGPPYRGLDAYDFADGPVFFGRDAAVGTALTRLMTAAEHGTAFLLVLGASGAGKSSLARAGLLPALVAAKAVPGVGLWRRVLMRPGDARHDPVAALASALLAGDARSGEGLPELSGPKAGAEELASHLRASAPDPSYPFRIALGELADRERSQRALLAHEEARLVLLVDQMEELFTQPDISAADRTVFAQILAGLARSGLVWVIATMRSDLWHRAVELPDLLSITEAGGRLDLLPPNGAELLEMVRKPARAVGIGFEEDAESGLSLDAVLANAAAAEPGALPLLSVLLEDLYRRDVLDADEAGRGRLTFTTYRALGELKGAIATRAEHIFRNVEERAPKAAAALPELLRALVTTSSGAAVTARPAKLADFAIGSPERALIEAFVAPDARLLTVEEREGEIEARLAHEALIAHWPRAARQVERDRRDIETRARLEGFMKGYQNASANQQADALLSGLPLEEGVDLVRRWSIAASTPLAEFIDLSSRRRKAERRRGYALAATLVVVFALIAAAAAFQWREATQQRAAAQGSQMEAELQAASAKAAAVLAQAETLKADQRAGLLATGTALRLANEGAIDPALLVLLRASQSFKDADAPDQLLISLNRVLEKGASYKRIPLSANIVAFDTPSSLYLYDPESGKLNAFGSDRPIYRGSRNDSLIVGLNPVEDGNHLLIARKTNDVERLDLKTGERVSLGRLDPLPGIDPQYSKLKLPAVGLAVREDLIEDKGLSIRIIDASTGRRFEQIVPDITTARYGRGSDGRLYVIGGSAVGFDTSFVLTPTALVPVQLDEAARQKVFYGRCIDQLPADARSEALKWLIENDQGGKTEPQFDCDVRGKSVLLTITVGTTGGYDRVDAIVTQRGLSQVRQKIADWSDTKLPQANLTWVGISPNGSFAALSNRSLITDGAVFHYQARPSAAHFLDDKRIVVFDPDEQQLVVHDLTNVDTVSMTTGNFSHGKPLTPLNPSDCTGNLPGPIEWKLKDGTQITFVNNDLHTVRRVNNKVLIDGSNSDRCTMISPDGLRLLRLSGDKIFIYNLAAAIQKGDLDGTELLQLPVSDVSSAFFLGNNKIVVSDGSNQILSWTPLPGGTWSSEEIYRGDNKIISAEPDERGDRLLIVDSLGHSDAHGVVYSLAAKQTFFDLGRDYKFFGATFDALGNAVVANHMEWTAMYRFLPLSQLVAAATDALSVACRSASKADYVHSPCWPRTVQ